MTRTSLKNRGMLWVCSPSMFRGILRWILLCIASVRCLGALPRCIASVHCLGGSSGVTPRWILRWILWKIFGAYVLTSLDKKGDPHTTMSHKRGKQIMTAIYQVCRLLAPVATTTMWARGDAIFHSFPSRYKQKEILPPFYLRKSI